MSLVAYGSSDDSEEESEEVKQVGNSIGTASDVSRARPSPTLVPSPSSNASLGKGSIRKDEEAGEPSLTATQSLFQSLPKPKQNICESIDEVEQLESHPDNIVPVDLGLLAFFPEPRSNSILSRARPTVESRSGKDSNKKTGPVKITVPSLSQFDDEKEDEPIKKKLKPSQKGSGLFAILPAPKNTKLRQTQQPLIPYIFTKKLTPTPDKSNHLNKSLGGLKPSKLSLEEGKNDSEDDEDEDFFSLNSVDNLSKRPADSSDIDHPLGFSPMTELETGPDTSAHSSNEEPLAFHSGFLPSPWANESPLPGPSRERLGPMPRPINSHDLSNKSEEDEWTSQEPNSSSPQENLQLDAEAMQRLCGRRSKKHEPVEFIDVSGKEIMPDPKEWLVKQLSEEQPKMRSHSHKRNDGPTTQQRRKHQITYLAFQAKENELELKNQWSQNRMSRKQTQSKYGF